MKSKFLGSFFLILSILFLTLWFNFNYATRQLEKKINHIESEIKISEEKKRVLLLEYAAHVSPIYLKKLSSIYLNYENQNNERIVVLNRNNFAKKVNKKNKSIPITSNNSLNILEINN